MAREALASAEASLNAFHFATSVDEKRRHWKDFLYSLAEVFEKLYAGAVGHPKDNPWAGGIRKRRKDDALLSYMHHARDARYHGLSPVARDADRYALVRDGVKLLTGPRDLVEQNIGSPEFAGCKLVPEPADLRLLDVTDDRHGDTFEVPRTAEFMMRPVPSTYGGLAWHRVRVIVEEAETRDLV